MLPGCRTSKIILLVLFFRIWEGTQVNKLIFEDCCFSTPIFPLKWFLSHLQRSRLRICDLLLTHNFTPIPFVLTVTIFLFHPNPVCCKKTKIIAFLKRTVNIFTPHLTFTSSHDVHIRLKRLAF